jgi:uncharacterized protein
MTLTRPEQLRIDLPLESIAGICQKYGVSELAVFGSILREDFDPATSDVDFLVRFINDDAGPWMRKYFEMEEEMSQVIGRKVDVIDWNAVIQSRNPYRRNHILNHARLLYER